jgi:hypothetical protein
MTRSHFIRMLCNAMLISSFDSAPGREVRILEAPGHEEDTRWMGDSQKHFVVRMKEDQGIQDEIRYNRYDHKDNNKQIQGSLLLLQM